MNRIVLTDEQARLLNPLEPAVICDPAGRVVASIPPVITPEEFARLRRAADCKGPFYSGAEVQQMLQALEAAWQREGPFGEERLREIIAQLEKAS